MSLWPQNEYQVGVISSLAWDTYACLAHTHTRLWWYSIYITKYRYTVNELHNVKDNCYNGAQLNSYEKIGICFLFTPQKNAKYLSKNYSKIFNLTTLQSNLSLSVNCCVDTTIVFLHAESIPTKEVCIAFTSYLNISQIQLSAYLKFNSIGFAALPLNILIEAKFAQYF